MKARQTTFSDIEYGNRKRITKREEFLDIMDEIIPWEEWVEFVRPYYPSGKRGRPVKGIETMLRMYLLQTWFNLSDEGVEDAIYDSYAFRKFMKIDFMTEQVPDATTLLKFRHMQKSPRKDRLPKYALAPRLQNGRHQNRLRVRRKARIRRGFDLWDRR